MNNEKKVKIHGDPFIRVKGAREHNLKNLDILIPKNKITVFTGLSGSGKTSLAFDTVYAEGQRRYVESLSAYARNFLEQLKKPEVDSITGLSPAIAIDQKSVGSNPRSTVGTVTEIYDYLRLLYAKVGLPLCPKHHVPVSSQTPAQIQKDILLKFARKKIYILAPMAQGKKGEFLAEFKKWSKKGFVKARVDGKMIELEKATKLAKTKSHEIDLVVDQLISEEKSKFRMSESIHLALSMADGKVIVEMAESPWHRVSFSIHSACPECGFSFPDLEPRLFSFNNPRGACAQCHGLGTLDLVEEEEFSDSEVGGRKWSGTKYKIREDLVKTNSKSKKSKVAIESDEENEVEEGDEFSLCPGCNGKRLREESLNVLIRNKNIAELSHLCASDLRDFFADKSLMQEFSGAKELVSVKIIKQIQNRLDYLIRVGTGYLSLDRSVQTLSGGESQRIRLATQVGSGLIGVLYVMDEPSIGLHPRDHHRLLNLIKELRDHGNTIILVEHDEDTIRSADFVVDLGPRAGILGGEILAMGTPLEIENNLKSVTGNYLARRVKIPIPQSRREKATQWLKIFGASGNNLKNVDLALPLGQFIAITGVSGSGKSTLIMDTLYRALSQNLYGAKLSPRPYKRIEGLDLIDKVVDINQRPIGRTPRSCPATYVGLFPIIRDLFSQLPDSRLRGYKPGQFSFNVKGGRCETCLGHGQIRVEMHFLSDVFVRCETCNGLRYNRETLQIKYNNKNIAEVLNMSVVEALEFFKNHLGIAKKIETLHRVGLDYMTLGQSSTTLSGGEAQRIKLSKELSRRGTGKTFYILDEPTTGLHFEDIRKLIELLQELVTQGNTVLVIEHNMEVVKSADFIVDMGPDGGSAGGRIVVTGSPEKVVMCKESETANYLKLLLDEAKVR